MYTKSTLKVTSNYSSVRFLSHFGMSFTFIETQINIIVPLVKRHNLCCCSFLSFFNFQLTVIVRIKPQFVWALWKKGKTFNSNFSTFISLSKCQDIFILFGINFLNFSNQFLYWCFFPQICKTLYRNKINLQHQRREFQVFEQGTYHLFAPGEKVH